MGVCNCSMFCCMLLYVHSSIEIILMGKRELVALLNLSSWCLVMVERLFLVVPWGCVRFMIVVFPDHTHLLFLVRLWDLRMCFSQFFQDIFYAWNTFLGTNIVELIKTSCQAKTGTQKLFINNSMNFPLN